jgi:circadian clock protein KaiB
MIPFGEEQPRRSEEKGPFVFRLYVVDEAPSSARAIANLSAICENHLPDNHLIEIVDLLQDPRRVLSDHILATPTLSSCRRLPFGRSSETWVRKQKCCVLWGCSNGPLETKR